MQPYQGHYNDLLVFLSIIIALLSCFTAFDLAERLVRGRRGHPYILLTSSILGIGLWSMHFMGMLAMEMNMMVYYHLPLLIFTLLIPIAVSYALLTLINNPRTRSKPHLFIGGLLFTSGILFMHYSGIFAMKISARNEQNISYALLSTLFALVVPLGMVFFQQKWLKNSYNMFSFQNIPLALLLTGSLTAMHYTAMTGASFVVTDSVNYNGRAPLLNDSLLGLLVGGAFLIIVVIVLGLLYRERQQVLTSARFNEQRYMALFEFSPDMVICIDPVHRNIVSANPTVHETTGYSREDLLGSKNIIDRQQDMLAINAAIEQAFQGHSSKLDHSIRTKAGRRMYCSSTVFPLVTDKQHLVYIVSKDVTELMQFQQELVIAKDAAESAVRMKSEFLATMSHEIRTPLNGILGINQLLADDLTTPEHLEMLKVQAESSGVLLNVINDILDLSGLEADSLRLYREPFQLSQLMQQSTEMFQGFARNKDLSLLLFVDPVIPDLLVGDCARIRQILVHLIGNAVKFTPSGAVTITVKPYGTDSKSRCLQFRVSDTGIGIDPDKLHLLFKPFSQLDASHNRKYSGTGLGLAICKKLVDLMDGEIWVEPAAGGGTEFTFRIMLQPIDDYMGPMLRKETEQSGEQLNSEVVRFAKKSPLTI
ncbi:ATP-binding protein [Paenibacillus monticola]|uniref:Circadian input-output histidine kinase CikA n=1 Tax=Paenibacillus monticola TaxID=2666075 RepID=A0A7X2H7Z9_9BACL|nr:ATP-binding protein [Paenibacillus monticola]MRN54468.1 PAS domain S-box protein [Paenibacillus monticola]